VRRKIVESIVISALIISGAVLVVTAVAAFLATNILELQSQHAEFEQGKANMGILSEIVEDVGVKPGAGSLIRFNQRTGGLGYVVESRPLMLSISNATTADLMTLSSSPMNMTYKAGRLVGTFNSTVKGKDDLAITGLSSPLALLKQQQANGAWLQLDFNRVRIVDESIVNVGGNQYYVVTISFFNVTPGVFRGSDSLDVKVQNTGVNSPTQFNYYHHDASTLSSNPNVVTITLSYGGITESAPAITQPSNTRGIIVLVTVSNLELSTL
jgi:hypothetical protein